MLASINFIRAATTHAHGAFETEMIDNASFQGGGSDYEHKQWYVLISSDTVWKGKRMFQCPKIQFRNHDHSFLTCEHITLISLVTRCLRCSSAQTTKCQCSKQKIKRAMNLSVPELRFGVGLAKCLWCLWLKSMRGRSRESADNPITGGKTSRATWVEVALKLHVAMLHNYRL